MRLKKSLYILLIILTITLTLGDTMTTLLCVQNGATELNPIANFLIENHLFVLVKVIVAVGLSWGILEAMKMDKITKIIVVSMSVVINITMFVAVVFNLIGLVTH